MFLVLLSFIGWDHVNQGTKTAKREDTLNLNFLLVSLRNGMQGLLWSFSKGLAEFSLLEGSSLPN